MSAWLQGPSAGENLEGCAGGINLHGCALNVPTEHVPGSCSPLEDLPKVRWGCWEILVLEPPYLLGEIYHFVYGGSLVITGRRDI